jgi:hypothetical protein
MGRRDCHEGSGNVKQQRVSSRPGFLSVTMLSLKMSPFMRASPTNYNMSCILPLSQLEAYIAGLCFIFANDRSLT